LLSIKLDKASSDSIISRTPQMNKEGYMTDLNSLTFNSVHEINDIKKARALLKSVITSNPNSASGWIAAARVEELDGKI
jgi:pre-mRNA-processing factor 6